MLQRGGRLRVIFGIISKDETVNCGSGPFVVIPNVQQLVQFNSKRLGRQRVGNLAGQRSVAGAPTSQALRKSRVVNAEPFL